MTATWEGRDVAALAADLGLPVLEYHPAVASTSDRVRSMVGEGAPAWAAVLADAQTAGRGRRGRGWVSPAGLGVWVSLALPADALDVDALLPVRVVSALARRLARAGCPGLAVKWPNDLLLSDGRKVAGILTERLAAPDREGRVILGVGINVLGVDAAAGSGAAALAEVWDAAARPPVLDAVVEAARDARAPRDALLDPGEMEAWSGRDALVGRTVSVEGAGRSPVSGTVQGMDRRGRLVLETGESVRHLASGTVRTGSSRRP